MYDPFGCIQEIAVACPVVLTLASAYETFEEEGYTLREFATYLCCSRFLLVARARSGGWYPRDIRKPPAMTSRRLDRKSPKSWRLRHGRDQIYGGLEIIGKYVQTNPTVLFRPSGKKDVAWTRGILIKFKYNSETTPFCQMRSFLFTEQRLCIHLGRSGPVLAGLSHFRPPLHPRPPQTQ